MAEHDQQERTERATPKRAQEARRDGQVARSQELSACVVLVAASTAITLLGGHLGNAVLDALRHGLAIAPAEALDETRMVPALSSALLEVGLACLPVFVIVVLAALLAPLAIGGWNFTTKALQPQFGRLNPLKGMQRIFSVRGLVELCKAFAKFGLVATLAVWSLWRSAPQLLGLGAQPTEVAIAAAFGLVGTTLIVLAAALVLIAGVDVPYQLWRHARELRMTRDQVKREYRESDGSPEVKGRIRQIQQTLAQGRMLQDVPTADVVVTNPTHYAVALRYERGMPAPICVAKGVDTVAFKIREVAKEHDIPIVENVSLARALYATVDVDDEIPVEHYHAVAEIIGYVMGLKRGLSGQRT